MEHLVCLNTNSFPAASAQQARGLFEDSLQGLLELNTGGDLFTLYLDHHQQEVTLLDFPLAEGFTYYDLTEQVKQDQEMDLLTFLLDLEDKSRSPALECIEEELLDDVLNYNFYMPGHPVVDYPDVLSLAYFLNATLLSINTAEQWNNDKFAIARIGDDGQFIDEKLTLNNIASFEHGQVLFERFSYVNIREICDSALLTDHLVEWYEEQTPENQRRIIDKFRLACERGFQGGKPLFKSLVDAGGLREIRFGAYSGGAIRILFKQLNDKQHGMLIGFIKKNDSEGYDENIKRALVLFNAFMVAK